MYLSFITPDEVPRIAIMVSINPSSLCPHLSRLLVSSTRAAVILLLTIALYVNECG